MVLIVLRNLVRSNTLTCIHKKCVATVAVANANNDYKIRRANEHTYTVR